MHFTLDVLAFRHGEPRTVILHRGQRGFGFVLRGAKSIGSVKDLTPLQSRVPALQYLDSVEPGSVADRAGLRPGDFILAVSHCYEPLESLSHRVTTRCFFFALVRRSTARISRRPRTRPSSTAFAVPVTWFN